MANNRTSDNQAQHRGTGLEYAAYRMVECDPKGEPLRRSAWGFGETARKIIEKRAGDNNILEAIQDLSERRTYVVQQRSAMTSAKIVQAAITAYQESARKAEQDATAAAQQIKATLTAQWQRSIHPHAQP